ncbi:hypothetical protein POM88_055013 [Heracleum sosnowskyi]|uniref:Uncharacterized protein n=1 Tax=Heracleum sosnowskyi TaxID=360622 RepID=A0AAD8GM35_9APIA|nr:hypothetical protein POM88_055013 [Heracleum sosnowskyi]
MSSEAVKEVPEEKKEVRGGEVAASSYWGVARPRVTKDDGTEWPWNCFMVVGANKGGVVALVEGLRGFVPFSQISTKVSSNHRICRGNSCLGMRRRGWRDLVTECCCRSCLKTGAYYFLVQKIQIKKEATFFNSGILWFFSYSLGCDAGSTKQ